MTKACCHAAYDSAKWALSLQFVFQERSVSPCQLSSVLCAGIDPDKHLDLQTLGWDKCTAAMEEAISSEKAEPIFQLAADKFQEVAATGRSPALSLLLDSCSIYGSKLRPDSDIWEESGVLHAACRGALTCDRGSCCHRWEPLKHTPNADMRVHCPQALRA